MSVIYKLLACHMLGDYVLQTDFLASTKGDSWWHLLAHCITYTVPFAFAFGIDGRIAALLVSHVVIDAVKARTPKSDSQLDQLVYALDQVSHLLAILVLYG